MKADLSRATFDKARRYRSVRMQQGRVQLDADFNEQQDILNHRIEIETRDSLGPVAVPIDNPGFGLSKEQADHLRVLARNHGHACFNATETERHWKYIDDALHNYTKE